MNYSDSKYKNQESIQSKKVIVLTAIDQNSLSGYKDTRRGRPNDTYSSRGRERVANDQRYDAYNRDTPPSGPRDNNRYNGQQNMNSNYDGGRRNERKRPYNDRYDRYNNQNNYSRNDQNSDSYYNGRAGNGYRNGKPQYNNGRPPYNNGKQQYNNGKQPYNHGKPPYNNGSYRDSGYEGRNDSFNRGNYDRYEEIEKPSPKPQEPPEQLLPKYEARLKELENIRSLEEIGGVDSKWGVKPKGFENVTSQRAKLSGLFPLPGYPRPVDFTKLEGVVKDRLSNTNDILIETSKIDPPDSRVARILIVKDIDFNNVDYLNVVDYFNNFLKSVDIPGILDQPIESKQKTKDNKNLIIQFKDNLCTTICLTLNGRSIEVNNQLIALNVSRPNEFVAQNIETDIIKDGQVLDNALKLSLIVKEEYEESDIMGALEKICPVAAFQLLRKKGTRESLGIAFVNFKLESSKDSIASIPVIQGFISKLLENEGDIFIDVKFSCIIPGETSVQECQSDIESLRKLVKSENVTNIKTLRVIQILNAVNAKDLMDDYNYNFIVQDIKQEAENYGHVESIKIPRPANDFTPGLTQFSEPGLGRIFIEYKEKDEAFKAIMGMAGRMYNDKTVICSYFDVEDYKRGIF